MRHHRAVIGAFICLLSLATALTASPERWQRAFPKTDFSRSAIDFAEIRDGGPGRDGIPAIDAPRFRMVSNETGLSPKEPVMVLAMEGVPARAYPIRYLMWHEIVNDQVGRTPIAVTFCPLCNSGLIFDRRVGGQVLDFGVSGLLRNSDMVMYDRQTESFWQQATATGIVGRYMGTELTALPAWMDAWENFRREYPDGLVLAAPATRRDYGRNPYVGYDRSERPFLYRGELPPHGIAALERVVRVGDKAWPVARLRDKGGVTEEGVTISWTAGQASALDHPRIPKGRDVGTIRVKDAATGQDMPHDVMFAFAFHAFWPDGAWMLE
ncbi:MAG: DUF3179 domain-containing protein [Pseudomonadota bacterium]